MVVSWWTQRSVATPPEYSHQQRQRKNRFVSKGCLGADPSQRFQSMRSGVASNGIGYTQAPSGEFRLSARRTIFTLPRTPDFTTSRALAVNGEVLPWLPTISSLPDFFTAWMMSRPSAMLHVIGFST
jgi:hypothetical protein